jgi:hypothetical protein
MLEVTQFAEKEEGEEEWMKKPLHIKFIQINLTHRKAATAVLCWQLAVGMAHVAFI